MLEEKKRIVKIIAEILKGKDQDFVALRSIDARLLLIDSELVFTRKMIEKIHELVQEGYLKWKNENYSSVGFTRKGLEYYTKTKKRNPLEQLKEEFEHLKKIVMKRFSNSEELQQYRIQHKSQFDRYYFLVEEIERLERAMLSPKEQARQKEVEKMSKLKREGKLYEYLINKKDREN
jgi:predicted transcriptional regulator